MRLLVCSVLGVMFGTGVATFIYANGHAYLSSDPAACVNCHVMRPQYDGWQKSSHHTAAVCVDCHMPQGTLAKLYTKAENGYLHSKAFTLQDYLDPIQMRPKSLRVANEACAKCHSDITAELGVHAKVGQDNGQYCTHCHQDVGH